MIYYPSFADLNKFKIRLLQEEAIEIESIDFVGCHISRLKDGISVATNISVEISMHIQIFIPVRASFFLKRIQISGLIIELTISKI